MPLATDLLALLADPETHEALSLASDAELSLLRQAIEQGQARRRDGKPAGLAFEAALFTPGRRVAYLVEGGIPNLLIDERLELSSSLPSA